MNTKPVDHAKDQAKAQLESITEMVAELEKAERDEEGKLDFDSTRHEKAEQTILEDALEVAIRDDWYSPGEPDSQRTAEYKILLCTGGPAVRIIGDLDGFIPETARLEYQDWGTPWTEYRLTAEEEKIILKYAACFYFGD